MLGGVRGIAGAFPLWQTSRRSCSTSSNPGTRSGISATWIDESFQVHTGDLLPARGLFWNPAPGTDPADGIYVHYGFTGTGMWASPKQGRWAVLLTNKLYYGRDRQALIEIRNAFCASAFE
ncbi:hypothetical protein [Nonomuraea jiangxiensis]|uniref:Beta-lactamase n=1 Tax=Nonomuraea jiangxiensis TaxID=633440 RepID=A0A1G8YQX6_9ACTN|nr:Beta-lactamase [Nonomuraea jiangxiensis]